MIGITGCGIGCREGNETILSTQYIKRPFIHQDNNTTPQLGSGFFFLELILGIWVGLAQGIKFLFVSAVIKSSVIQWPISADIKSLTR